MKLLKITLLIAVTAILMGCSPSTSERTDNYNMPHELKDRGCRIYNMYDGFSNISVLVCDKLDCTNTSTLAGKVTHNTAYCE